MANISELLWSMSTEVEKKAHAIKSVRPGLNKQVNQLRDDFSKVEQELTRILSTMEEMEKGYIATRSQYRGVSGKSYWTTQIKPF